MYKGICQSLVYLFNIFQSINNNNLINYKIKVIASNVSRMQVHNIGIYVRRYHADRKLLLFV